MFDESFSGSKIALMCKGELLTYQRDNLSHIPFPGMWDLPGGGREAKETPEECVLRELREEFNLILTPERIMWKRRYESRKNNGLATYFFVARITEEDVAGIQFGDEGQRWKMMAIKTFLDNKDAVPDLVQRLGEYLSQ